MWPGPMLPPVASSVEPPPTSTTPRRSTSRSSSPCRAPVNESWASSSPLSSRIGRPAARSTAPRSSSPFSASRTAAVPSRAIPSTPICVASAASAPTTWAVSVIFSGETWPPAPMRVKIRRADSARTRPSLTSATSSRVVLLPMSMQPYTG